MFICWTIAWQYGFEDNLLHRDVACIFPSSLTALSQAWLPGPKYQAFGIEAQNCSYQFSEMLSSLPSGSPAVYKISCILPFNLIQSWTLLEGKVLHLPCIGAYHSWWRIRTLIKRPLDWKRRREVEMQNFSLLSGTPHDPTLLWLSSLHFILFESHPHT